MSRLALAALLLLAACAGNPGPSRGAGVLAATRPTIEARNPFFCPRAHQP